MRKWAILLHFYQPPTQHPGLTEHVLTTCYLPVLDILLRNPEARVSLNLGASLLSQLRGLGKDDFFGKIRQLLDRGQVELTAFPSNHPLSPLVPGPVLADLIDDHRRALATSFPQARTRCVYPPELAIDAGSLAVFAARSECCIVDESSVDPRWNPAAIGPVLYRHRGYRLLASSRHLTEILRAFPSAIDGAKFLEHLKRVTRDDQVFFSVNDVEIFGHHYQERIHLLEALFRSEELAFCTIGDLLESEATAAIDVRHVAPSTWETTKDCAAAGNPWPLWLNPDNRQQQMYHRLAGMAYDALRMIPPAEAGGNEAYGVAQDHYHRGLSSCHYYWLSNKPWWHPDISLSGATHLIKCIRTLPIEPTAKGAAEDVFHELSREIWRYNWSDRPQNGYAAFDAARRSMIRDMPNIG